MRQTDSECRMLRLYWRSHLMPRCGCIVDQWGIGSQSDDCRVHMLYKRQPLLSSFGFMDLPAVDPKSTPPFP